MPFQKKPVAPAAPPTREQLLAFELDKVKKLKRMIAAVESRDSLLKFTRFTMPDPEDVDDTEKSLFEINWHHEAICQFLEKMEKGEILRGIITMPPRHGKALSVDTPIPTPTGWERMGDLRVGDEVFDETGWPTRIVAVSPVMKDRPVYRVETDDGDEIIADRDHEWLVRLCRKHQRFGVRTTDWLHWRQGEMRDFRAPMIRAQGALELPDAELPIDPYVLGVWLGDGRTDTSAMCSADDEIIENVAAIEGGINFYAQSGVTKHFRVGPHYRHGATQAETLQGRLRDLDLLGNKRIPIQYLRASRTQRLELLQGIVDTDGHVAPNGQIAITSVKKALAEDVLELVRSLGTKGFLTEGNATIYGRFISKKYNVSFYLSGAARLTRKKINCRDGVLSQRRYITIQDAGTADTVCIQVESDSQMFLCGKSFLPTHNSEIASRRFIPWFLGRDPYRQTIFTTYAADFAEDFGRKVREIIETPAYRQVFPRVSLKAKSKAADRMETEAGGMAVFIGVGGPATGRGADFFLIDDPFKNREEAESLTHRNKVWDWLTSVAYTRLMPNGRMLLICTRWHPDDAAGRIFNTDFIPKRESAKWKRLDLPAIIEESGEDERALWPTRYPLEVLKSTRDFIGERDWNALYQQRPTPPEGAFFKQEMIFTYGEDEMPRNFRPYITGDLALGTKKTNDETCVCKWMLDENDTLFLHPDIFWDRKSADDSVERIIDMMVTFNPMATWWEKGQIDRAVGPFFRKRMVERKVYAWLTALPVKNDKAFRAASIRGRMALGMVKFPRFASWWPRAKEQLLKFTGNDGDADDFVDACSLIGQALGSQFRADKPEAAGGNVIPITGTLGWIKYDSDHRKREAERLAARKGF